MVQIKAPSISSTERPGIEPFSTAAAAATSGEEKEVPSTFPKAVSTFSPGPTKVNASPEFEKTD